MSLYNTCPSASVCLETISRKFWCTDEIKDERTLSSVLLEKWDGLVSHHKICTIKTFCWISTGWKCHIFFVFRNILFIYCWVWENLCRIPSTAGTEYEILLTNDQFHHLHYSLHSSSDSSNSCEISSSVNFLFFIIMAQNKKIGILKCVHLKAKSGSRDSGWCLQISSYTFLKYIIILQAMQ